MRISDWSSDVCSSDLGTGGARHQQHGEDERALAAVEVTEMPEHDAADGPHDEAAEIGRETRQDDRHRVGLGKPRMPDLRCEIDVDDEREALEPVPYHGRAATASGPEGQGFDASGAGTGQGAK